MSSRLNTIPPTGNGVSGQESVSDMARKLFQTGWLEPRDNGYYGCWREIVVTKEGKKRKTKKVFLGSHKDLKTKTMARRALDKVMREEGVNDLTKRPRVYMSFKELAEKWMELVMPNHTPASRASEKSHLNIHLVPAFGQMPVSDLDVLTLEQWFSTLPLETKSKRNIRQTLSLLLKSAKKWGVVERNVALDVELPQVIKKAQPVFTLDEMIKIVNNAPEPFKTLYRILAETGMRIGEALALRKCDIQGRMIIVQRAISAGEISTTKSKKPRVFCLSPELAEHLSQWGEGELFLKPSGAIWDDSDLMQDVFYPYLDSIGVQRKGFHAFRRGNASVMDHLNAPMKVRQDRLGHVDMEMTMHYTQASSHDHQQIAEQLGQMLTRRVM